MNSWNADFTRGQAMLTFWGQGQAYCDGVTRRGFLRLGGLGLAGLSLADLLRAEARGGEAGRDS